MVDIKNAKRVVVKVGSSTLTYDNGKLNLRRVEKLVRTLADLRNSGHEVILVTSGSVALGVAVLGLKKRPDDLRSRQAAAAVGQSQLMNIYSRLFAEYGYNVAQLLLTRDVVDDAEIKRNVSETFEILINYGAIPIVNENDTVSTYEMQHLQTFGENDTLSAMVAELTGAQLLIILSDIDGFYSGDPRKDDDARLIPVVREITEELEKMAGGSGSARGKGGMATKISAAKHVMGLNIPMVIMSGERPEMIFDLFDGRSVGTLFTSKE